MKFKKSLLVTGVLSSVIILSSCSNSISSNYSAKKISSEKISENILIDKDTGMIYFVNENKNATIYSILNYYPGMDLIIPEKINSLTVDSISYKSFKSFKFNKVVFPSSLKYVEESAFEKSTIQKLEFNGDISLSFSKNAFKQTFINNIESKSDNFVYENKVLLSKDKKTPYIIDKNSSVYILDEQKDTQENNLKILDLRQTGWNNLDNVSLYGHDIYKIYLSKEFTSTLKEPNFLIEAFNRNLDYTTFSSLINYSNIDYDINKLDLSLSSYYKVVDRIIYEDLGDSYSVTGYDDGFSVEELKLETEINKKPVNQIASNSFTGISNTSKPLKFSIPKNIKIIHSSAFSNSYFSSLTFEERDQNNDLAININAFSNSNIDRLFLNKSFINSYNKKTQLTTFVSNPYENIFLNSVITNLEIELSSEKFTIFDLLYIGIKDTGNINIEREEQITGIKEDKYFKLDLSNNTLSIKPESVDKFIDSKKIIFPADIDGGNYISIDNESVDILNQDNITSSIEEIEIQNSLSFLNNKIFKDFNKLKKINVYGNNNLNNFSNFEFHDAVKNSIDIFYSNPFVVNKVDGNINKILVGPNQKELVINESSEGYRILSSGPNLISENNKIEYILLQSPWIHFDDNAFSNLNSLKKIDIYIDQIHADYELYKDNLFYLNKQKKKLGLNESVEVNYINKEVIIDNTLVHLLADESSKEVLITNTKIKDISSGALSHLSQLEILHLPEKIDLLSLNKDAFKNNTKLKKVLIYKFKTDQLQNDWNNYFSTNYPELNLEILFLDDIYVFDSKKTIIGLNDNLKNVVHKLNFQFSGWNNTIQSDSFKSLSITELSEIGYGLKQTIIGYNAFDNNNLSFLSLSTAREVNTNNNSFINNPIKLVKYSHVSNINPRAFDNKDILYLGKVYVFDLKNPYYRPSLSLRSIRYDISENNSNMTLLDGALSVLGRIGLKVTEIQSYAFSNNNNEKVNQYSIPNTITNIQANAFFNSTKDATIYSESRIDLESESAKNKYSISKDSKYDIRSDYIIKTSEDLEFDPYDYSVSFTNDSENIYLPSYYNQYPVKSIKNIKNINDSSIIELFIPNSIEHISDNAFNNSKVVNIINESNINLIDKDYLDNIGISNYDYIDQNLSVDHSKYFEYDIVQPNKYEKYISITKLSDEFWKNQDLNYIQVPSNIDGIEIKEIKDNAFDPTIGSFTKKLNAVLFDKNISRIKVGKQAFANNNIKIQEIDESVLDIKQDESVTDKVVPYNIYENNPIPSNVKIIFLDGAINKYTDYFIDLVSKLDTKTQSFQLYSLLNYSSIELYKINSFNTYLQIQSNPSSYYKDISLNKINSKSINNMDSPIKLYIPDTVKSIDAQGIYNLSKLETIFIASTEMYLINNALIDEGNSICLKWLPVLKEIRVYMSKASNKLFFFNISSEEDGPNYKIVLTATDTKNPFYDLTK